MKRRFPGFVLLVLIASCTTKQDTKRQAIVAKPNILFIVADDLGYGDIEPFGGTVPTPALKALATEGVKLSNFHVQPTCSPTRASLLTGNDNHVAGFGVMDETMYPDLRSKNLPGYAGHLSKQVVTIPELLRDNGYHTYMAGKWHLGEGSGHDPFDRGFEETFILTTGGGSHWNDKKALSPLQHMEYTRNGNVTELPEDFYSTRNYTDSMIRFIEQHREDGKPFFGYLAYTAVHDPLQVPKEYIDKYKGKFDMGWDSLYEVHVQNLQHLGLVPPGVKSVRNPGIPKWAGLAKEKKEAFARDMEVYAAMIDYLDMSIQRILDYLRKEGLYDNTMIVFMSDNGANGAVATTYPGNADGKYLGTFNNDMSNRGFVNSYVEIGPGWAQAVSAPYRAFKTVVAEGGIKAPLIVKMPGTMKNAGQWNKAFAHVTDIMPSVLALTDISYPVAYMGNAIHPVIGRSLLPVFSGDSASVHTGHGMGWELFEMKAYIRDQWKIMRLPFPFGSGEWELYDLEKDPGETTDISKQYPDVKQQLLAGWNEYAHVNEVYDHAGHFDAVYRKSFSGGGH